MSRPAPSNITIVELDPALAPLGRVKIPNGRSGYVHYGVLAKRLLGAMGAPETVTGADTIGEAPILLPGKGLMIWPKAHCMAYLQAEPVKRIRCADGTISAPMPLCPLIWIWKFGAISPYVLQHSRLFCARTLPMLPGDQIAMSPWPFGNVHPDGEVCWGNVHTNNVKWEKPEDADALFWDTKPNNDLLYAPVSISDWVAEGSPDSDHIVQRPLITLAMDHERLRTIAAEVAQVNNIRD